MRIAKAFVILLLLITSIFGYSQVVTDTLEVYTDAWHIMDGRAPTNVWGFARPGQRLRVPAPLLRYNHNDSAYLTMVDSSGHEHTIHLHGLDVDQINDGVPSTSFTVPINGNYTYKFKTDHPGTYLYHCHVESTVHLQMGMYGMIVVEYDTATNEIYANGPRYDEQFELLASDMDISWHDFPSSSWPQNNFDADYFMINGYSGGQLTGNTFTQVTCEQGEKVALRLANISYSTTEWVFPESANATAWMSDGRQLPDSMPCDTLMMYPGERYTVMLAPSEPLTDWITVNFYNSINNELDGVCLVDYNVSEPASIETFEPQTFQIRPNPAGSFILLPEEILGEFVIIDSRGKVQSTGRLSSESQRIDVSALSPGVYLLRAGNAYSKFVKTTGE